MRIVLAVVLSMGLTFSANADEGDSWACSVTMFVNSSPFFKQDEEFNEKNKRKTFTLVDGGATITAVSHSTDFKQGSTRYSVVSRGVLDVAAVAKGAVGLDAVVLSRVPQEQYNGAHSATLTVQSSIGVNTWFLSCSKI